MDLNSLLQNGAQLFQSQLDTDRDGQVDMSEISSALMSLFSNNQGQFNLSSIISSMQKGGNNDLMELAASWLGSGENKPISGNQLFDILGRDNILAFAKRLGINETSALSGLQEALPKMVDQASPNGSLLDLGEQLLNSVGGVSGAMGLLSRLFGRTKPNNSTTG